MYDPVAGDSLQKNLRSQNSDWRLIDLRSVYPDLRSAIGYSAIRDRLF